MIFLNASGCWVQPHPNGQEGGQCPFSVQATTQMIKGENNALLVADLDRLRRDADTNGELSSPFVICVGTASSGWTHFIIYFCC
jgi:hypothetical protein